MPSIMDAFLGDWLIEYSAARCQQCRWRDYCTKISVSKLLRYRERQRRALRKWDAKVIVATPGKQKRRRRRLLGGAVTVWRHGCLRRCCWTGHQSGDRHRPG
ncbi:hypothetical protein BHE74_00018832 [Ensete ventricosum]|nr:hypothetical protein BHE74_00018832 [Ensete ventricosum]